MNTGPAGRRAAVPATGPYDPAGVTIRLAGPRARYACLGIDDGYTSPRVWQAVDRAFDDPPGALAPSAGDGADTPFSVTFQPLRLPRPIHEPGLYTLRTPEARYAAWLAADCLMVAGPMPPPPPPADPDAAPVETPDPVVWGYLALKAVPSARVALIAELAVAPEHRRRGLGGMLLTAARAWAAASAADGGAGGLPVLMIELAPRNYPAIAFCRRQGFHFAGYTDYSLAGGDLRLFFIRPTG